MQTKEMMVRKNGGTNGSTQTRMTIQQFCALFIYFSVLWQSSNLGACAQCTDVCRLEAYQEPDGFVEVFRAELSGDIAITTGASAQCITSLFENIDHGPYINTTRITWTVAPNLDQSNSGYYLNYTRILTNPPYAVIPQISGDDHTKRIHFTHTPAWIDAQEVGVIVLVPAQRLRDFEHFDQTPSNVQVNRGFSSIERVGITSSSAGWGSTDCFPGETLNFSASLMDNQVEDWTLYINSRASHIAIEAPSFRRMVITAPNSLLRLKGSVNTTDTSYENVIDGGQEGSCVGDDYPGTHVQFDGRLEGSMELTNPPSVFNVDEITFPVRVMERTFANTNVTFQYNSRNGTFNCISGCKNDGGCVNCQPSNESIIQSLDAFPCTNSRESYLDRLACSRGVYYCNCFLDRHAQDYSASPSLWMPRTFLTISVTAMALGLSI